MTLPTLHTEQFTQRPCWNCGGSSDHVTIGTRRYWHWVCLMKQWRFTERVTYCSRDVLPLRQLQLVSNPTGTAALLRYFPLDKYVQRQHSPTLRAAAIVARDTGIHVIASTFNPAVLATALAAPMTVTAKATAADGFWRRYETSNSFAAVRKGGSS